MLERFTRIEKSLGIAQRPSKQRIGAIGASSSGDSMPATPPPPQTE
jgi:hypothetical protein